jgi:carboxyl-terminal processing protease
MRSRGITVAIVLSSALASGGWLMQRGLRGAGSSAAGARLYEQVLGRVAHQYVDSIPLAELYDKSVTGLLDELGDPHSVFLEQERLRALTESTTGRYAGVGIQMDLRDGWITVVAPLPGSPADRVGVQTGDRLVEIDGKLTAGWTADEASRALRGAPGTLVRLSLERPGVTERIPVQLNRQQIHVPSVRYADMIGNGVGYVDLTIFSETSAKELRDAIDTLRARGMRRLVLDLRGNPGGLLDQGVEIAEMFLDDGERVVSTRGRTPDATREFTDDGDQRWPDMPIVVLVDNGSASASEIVAGALQDQDRAAIVGATTFGKGSAQSLFPLPAVGALKLTTAKWFTPLGRSIDRSERPSEDDDDVGREPPKREQLRTPAGRTVLGGGGITPDVVIEDSLRPGNELALERALGKDITRFRDVLATYALELKGRRAVADASFTVTPAMRDELYARLRARGVLLDRDVYDGAEPLVTRILGSQIARYVFGPDAEYARALRQDRAMAVALELLNASRSPDDLLNRAATKQAALIQARGDSTARSTAAAP